MPAYTLSLVAKQCRLDFGVETSRPHLECMPAVMGTCLSTIKDTGLQGQPYVEITFFCAYRYDQFDYTTARQMHR